MPPSELRLNASSGVGEPSFNPSRLKIPDYKRDSHLAQCFRALAQASGGSQSGKLAFFVNASLGKKQLILAALAGITPVVLRFLPLVPPLGSLPLDCQNHAPNSKEKTEKVAPNQPQPAFPLSVNRNQQ
ncbi:MAG UNVERIFIED_CONTAM: hypothetical protein LVR29_16025 [Microcystis novacekii LVE1205-3]